MASIKKVKCPTCQKMGDWFAGPFGPFCSKRCKLVDLGKWFNQENVITEPLRPEHFQPDEELAAGDYLDKPEEPK
ncbi:MAG: DNA gyrase inhibitor YacG [Verrucomicrobiales bacterium]|nr:DNA gyrase inhibitor YacG [Verrucomicrobiales bacterium]